jgi:predicted amidohydrolase
VSKEFNLGLIQMSCTADVQANFEKTLDYIEDAATRGAQIICIHTAIGYSRLEEGPTYDQAWQIVQRGHAVANACFLAAVNRVGFEEDPSRSAVCLLYVNLLFGIVFAFYAGICLVLAGSFCRCRP